MINNHWVMGDRNEWLSKAADRLKLCTRSKIYFVMWC